MKTKSEIDLEVTSGNVFTDLGLPNAEESYLKAQLLVAILRRVEADGLSQAAVARATGLTQPNVSLLLNARLRGFSVARLFTILNRLGMAVEVRVVAQPTERLAAATVVKVPSMRRIASAKPTVRQATRAKAPRAGAGTRKRSVV